MNYVSNSACTAKLTAHADQKQYPNAVQSSAAYISMRSWEKPKFIV